MLIAFFIAVVVTLVGLRLAALGVQRRSAPEFMLGSAVALLQPGTALLSYALQDSMPGLIPFSLACVTAGTVAMAAFAQRTFRARVGWARAVLLSLAALLLYGHLLQLPLLLASGEPHLAYLASRVLLLGWAAYEALRHRALYARRARLGMVNPVIANRFLLFGVWTSSMALNSALTILIVSLDLRYGLLDWRVWVFGMARAISLVLLTSMWLIFFPPRGYLHWIERRFAQRMKLLEAQP